MRPIVVVCGFLWISTSRTSTMLFGMFRFKNIRYADWWMNKYVENTFDTMHLWTASEHLVLDGIYMVKWLNDMEMVFNICKAIVVVVLLMLAKGVLRIAFENWIEWNSNGRHAIFNYTSNSLVSLQRSELIYNSDQLFVDIAGLKRFLVVQPDRKISYEKGSFLYAGMLYCIL